MAKITRRMAINNVQQILSKYRTKIIEGKNYIDYLPLQGKEIVNKYNNNTNDYKSLLDAAVHSKDFFIGIDDETLILYTNICDKINNVFDLNISESKKITGFIDERFVVRSAEEVITGIRTVEIGRKVEYKLGTADKLQEDLKVFNRYYGEWEVEDIDNNFSDVHNTFESVAEDIVDYLDNNFANRYDRTFEAVKEGRYIIKAKVHDLVIGNVVDTIEFEQIVETGDETIIAMELQQKILRAIELTDWKVDLDFAALAEALFKATVVIIAIAAIATIAPELAVAIIAIMTIGMGIDATINIIKGIVQLAEALQLIEKARSERALQVGGEKIKEGILDIGVGIIELLLKKLTIKNLSSAKTQVLRNVTPKPQLLPQTALPPSTSSFPVANATSTEIVTAVNRGTSKALATVSQMSVLQSEKAALQEMVSEQVIRFRNEQIRDYNNLTYEEKKQLLSEITSKEMYEMIQENSNCNWIIREYDLITKDNIKDIVILRSDGSLNLNWPKYAGLQLESIESIGSMSGKVYVSRSGSPSGNTIGYGNTVEAWYASNSQRAIPSSTSEIQVGIMDVDKYKKVIEIISSNVKNSIIKEALLKEGFSAEQSLNLINEYKSWNKNRFEVFGKDGIVDGLNSINKSIEPTYGYSGKIASWSIANLKMEGGAGQLNTVFSWKTLINTQIITGESTVFIK